MINDTGLLHELKILVHEMHTKNTDLVISIFGKERTGKSTLAANLAKLLDSTFNAKNLPKRVGLTFADFARIAPTIAPFQVLWVDEAGMFSKRDSYGVKNRGMVNYFQEAGGSKRIYILCYPEIIEIDRKVLQRSRLFFETTNKGGQYWVKGWTEDQMDKKRAELRLFAAKSIAARWGQTPRVPTKIFQCDYTGIEDVMEAYGKLKELNLERTDDKLSELAEMNMSEIAVQAGYKIKELTGLKYQRRQLYKYVRDALNTEIESGNVDEYDYYEGPRDICIRDMALADRIIENVLQSFPKRDYAVDEKCINAQNTNYNLPPPILKKTTFNSNKEKECSQSIQ